MRRSHIVATCIALVAFCISGQDSRSTITGQVADASSAAIAGATVRAVQRNTNQAITATTNRDGYYTLTYLQPSTYDIQVTAPGFNKLRLENIRLMVSHTMYL